MCRTQISPERIPVTKTWVRQTRNAKTASRLRRLCPCFFLWPDSIRAPNPSLNSILSFSKVQMPGKPCFRLSNSELRPTCRVSVRAPAVDHSPGSVASKTRPRRTMSNFQARLRTYYTARSNEMRYFVTLTNFPGAAVRFIPVVAWHNRDREALVRPKDTGDGKILFLHIAKNGGRTMENLCVLNCDRGLYRTCVYRNVCNARVVLL